MKIPGESIKLKLATLTNFRFVLYIRALEVP